MLISKMADTMVPTNRTVQTLSPPATAWEPLPLKAEALMSLLHTQLIAVNYELCIHCGPTKEDVPALQSDVITKVRLTPPV